MAGAGGGAHRVSETASPANRRGMIAAGGALVVLGQAAFSQVLEPERPLLPDFGELLSFDEPAAATAGVASGAAPVAVAPASSAELVTAPARGAFEPVRSAPIEELRQADVDSLVKASGLAEAARAAEDAQKKASAAQAARLADTPAVRGGDCAPNTLGFGAVKSWVGDAGQWLRCAFGVKSVGGVAGRAGTSDHPFGLALDFMVNRSTGDRLADYALKYRKELKIKYVIWKQRINYGSGWESMEDRGSITANHFDHVHISFLK